MTMRDFVSMTRRVVQKEITRLQGGVLSPYIYGTWLGSESVDNQLSKVQLADGTVVRGVRKLDHVGGLVEGSQVLMLKHGAVPLTIIGKVVGGITKYKVT